MDHIDLSALNFSEEASALLDLWGSLPRQKGYYCPEKSSFSPVSLGKNLKFIFMLEREDHETLLVRVSGSDIRENLGQEITGKNLFDLLPTEYLFSFKEYYTSLQHYPCAGKVIRPVARPTGGRQLLRTLHLPLLDHNGHARFFVGVMNVERLPMPFDELNNGVLAPRPALEMIHVDLGAGLPGLRAVEPNCA